MISMAQVLITQQRIYNFRYYCLAQLQVPNENDALRVSII